MKLTKQTKIYLGVALGIVAIGSISTIVYLDNKKKKEAAAALAAKQNPTAQIVGDVQTLISDFSKQPAKS